MLYRIGTVKEIGILRGSFTRDIFEQLNACTQTLDEAYGADRNYSETGGYSLIAETREDIDQIRAIINFEQHPCEWVDRLDGDYLSALYLMNDDYSIVVFMPLAIAPEVLLHELED